jgi:hypothetical protein
VLIHLLMRGIKIPPASGGGGDLTEESRNAFIGLVHILEGPKRS